MNAIRRQCHIVVSWGAEGNSIVLNPAVFILMMNPKTYNYLFMLFHQFRISPNKNSAKQFASLALSSLRKNLGEDPQTWISIDDMITDFHSVATRFVQDNKEAIESISFETLQNDAVIADNSLVQTLESEQEDNDLANRLKAFENGPEYDRVIEQIVDGTFLKHSIEDINKQVQLEEERSKKLEEQIFARRIVVSLNIIYMFCDAIRIMLTNRHASITFKNREQIETCRRELMKLDDRLVHVVYSNLNSQEMGMLEYREHAGITTNSLSDQEIQEEEYRNSLFADALKDTIGQMVDNIENQDVDQLLETKINVAKMPRLCYPICT